MAQFTAKGPLKPLLNVEAMPYGLETVDPYIFSIQLHKRQRRVRSIGSTRRFSSFAYKSRHFNIMGHNGVQYEDEEFEFERDELDCFRGLVLDISYRFVSI